jgi:D-aminopeptidase
MSEQKRARLRELGLRVGRMACGPLNAITDVAGVRVGHVEVRADIPAVVRSGVTAICPLESEFLEETVFAGFHCFNGFGEMTGSHWVNETGILTSPICLSSAFSVGVLRDALMALPAERGVKERWHQPVAGETFDGMLNDGWAGPIERAHVGQAIAAAKGGAVSEGNVGGGSGMFCHEFKGGIGTSSRQADTGCGRFTVGVLVQSNYGVRSELCIDGVPVGRHIGYDLVESPQRREQGSIVIITATDAPLLPPQLKRLAQRACIGLSRIGGFGSNRSGDFSLAFSTANRLPFHERAIIGGLSMLPNEAMNPLFRAAAEACEEAIANSLTKAETMTGQDNLTAHALPLDLLVEIMGRYGRGPGS